MVEGHSKACEMAKHDRCVCSCGGKLHGIGNGHVKKSDLYDFILSEELAKPFRENINKDIKCHVCGDWLHTLDIVGYREPPRYWVKGIGWTWLFVICACEYQWALWKIAEEI